MGFMTGNHDDNSVPSNKKAKRSLRRSQKSPISVGIDFFDDAFADSVETFEKSPRKGFRKLVGITSIFALVMASFTIVPTIALASLMDTGKNWWGLQVLDVAGDQPLAQPSVMLDADGNEFAKLYAENRIPLTYENIPTQFVDALIATEDENFWTHDGVYWPAIIRAGLANLTNQEIVSGASGITQQYVKNLLITHAVDEDAVDTATEISLRRKLQEAATALKLEDKYSKEEILTGYTNTIFFGNGAYGLGAAAKYYFGKDAKDLTLAENALLVGTIVSPGKTNPVDNVEQALERRGYVLQRMVDTGYITEAEAKEANKEEVVLKITETSNGCPASPYPFYCEWVRTTILSDETFGATEQARRDLLYKGGLIIKTALRPQAQQAADAAAHDSSPAEQDAATSIAMVEPGTGKVLAIATSKGFGNGPGQTEIVLPVVPEFQIGSTFKPITAVAALEAGWDVNEWFYAPAVYKGSQNNAGGAGATRDMQSALNYSMNTWFMILQDEAGTQRVAETANAMGMKSIVPDGSGRMDPITPTLTLGTIETSPLQLANVYATIAAHGVACNTINIVEVVNTAGDKIAAPDADCKQVIRASSADTMAKLLQGPIKSGFSGLAALDGRPVAGKSGTTDNSAAVTFAGFTPQIAAAAWMGDPRGGFEHPLTSVQSFGRTWSPVYGSGPPAVLFKQAMDGAHAGLEALPFTPAGGDTYVGVRSIVPDVRGMSEKDAKQILTNAGLKVQVERDGGKVKGLDVGRVASQDPAGGSANPGNNTVTLHLTTISAKTE